MLAPLQHLNRFYPVVGDRGADTELAEHLHGDLLIGGIIINHENVRFAGKIELERDNRSRFTHGIGDGESYPDCKGGADPCRRSHVNLAAHQLGQTLANGEAETGAANLRVVEASP